MDKFIVNWTVLLPAKYCSSFILQQSFEKHMLLGVDCQQPNTPEAKLQLVHPPSVN